PSLRAAAGAVASPTPVSLRERLMIERDEDVTPAEAEAQSGQEADAGEGPPPGPKMVRRVVVSYQLGWLPGDWLQTWRRLDRTFARADLQVKAILAPLEDLPPETDILV